MILSINPTGLTRLAAEGFGRANQITCREDQVVFHTAMANIADNHEDLTYPAVGSWSAITAAHGDLSTVDPLVEEFSMPSDVYRFPAMVELEGLGPASDALVGRKRWSNPAVRLQKAQLLRPTDD